MMPPPGPAPVIVMKDVGGLVDDYQRQTEIYRKEGREVRLHECRSACTLALSLPNVCVYPASVLRFHQAYNRDTKQVDHGISDKLFSSYPDPIRRRLGYLTRHYRSLSGAELIELGVRDCNESAVMFAQRKQGAGGTQVASATPSGAEKPGVLSRLAGRITAALNLPVGPLATVTDARAAAPAGVSLQTPAPLPPLRPANIADPLPVASVPDEDQGMSPPLPPVRPPNLETRPMQTAALTRPDNLRMSGQLPKLITGAWPVLPPTFSAYAPLR